MSTPMPHAVSPPTTSSVGLLESVNVGTPRTVEWRGRHVTTSIWKSPVAGVNVQGDDQADRAVHGGPDKAVYAYAAEDYDWWSRKLGSDIGPGTFGDNLTVRGIPVSGALVGERWRVGSVLLEVSQPRIPCYKLAIRMDDPWFLRTFAAAGRPGAYLRILEPGELAAGNPVDVVYRPDHGLTVADVSHIYFRDRAQAGRLLQAPQLAASWHDWARSRQR